MANISLADGFGLDVDAKLEPKSSFAKFFQQPPSFSVLQQNLANVQNTPLAGFPLKSTEIGLGFKQPVTVSTSSPQFGGSAAAAATLCVVCSGKLFDPDPYDNPIDVPKGHAYLGLGMKITLAPKVSFGAGKVSFGFAAGTTVSMTHYRMFASTTTAPTFVTALQTSLQNYVLPLTLEDFATLGVGDVTVLEGTGSIELTGTYDILTAVNPLASVSVAVLPVKLDIQDGAQVKITASCTITGELQVRVQKVDAGIVRLGFYRKRGAEFTVQVKESVGVTAGTSSTDFISTILGAIDRSPIPTAAQLKEAGLTEEKQELIVKALKAAIQRRLELSILEELHAKTSQEAAFLYEVALDDLDDDGRAAIQNALKLNLSGLWMSANSLPRGIREVQNVLTTVRAGGHSLKINLLGIYNYTSVSDLALKGTVLTDAASGEVVITDTATATRVSGSVNFLADSDKLRKALAESFLITAAYRCSGVIAHAPTLKASYWHFAEHAQTDRPTMAANLNVLRLLGLISAAQEQQNLGATQDFGRSTCYVSTDYDDALSQSLFLRPDGQPREVTDYEAIGRDMLRQLIGPGADDQFRLRTLDEAMWPKVKEAAGVPNNLASVFPDLSRELQIPVVADDYALIEWWAKSMTRLAKSLSAARRFFSQSPPPEANSPAFKRVQSDLWKEMADVVSNTHDQFSQPWGLLVMDQASGQKSLAKARICSLALTLKVERTLRSSLAL